MSVKLVLHDQTSSNAKHHKYFIYDSPSIFRWYYFPYQSGRFCQKWANEDILVSWVRRIAWLMQ
eukprot:15336528-Ditylum_brightwellii.AAC.1